MRTLLNSTITTTTRTWRASPSGRRDAEEEDVLAVTTARLPTSNARTGPRRDAADPRASAWVSANAGTGKTHVLTMRVLRLMLAGTHRPSASSALTYTKAAAAEMSKRVFARWRSG